MDKQYDVSAEMKRLFEIKNKQRAEAKEYYQKLLFNPYRPINDGIPYDPAIVRYNALLYYRYNYYPATPRFFFKVFLLLSPILLITMGVNYNRIRRENKFRSGITKFEDRMNLRFL